MKPEITDAIFALHPTNSFVLRGDNYSQIEWVNTPPKSPSTQKQVEDKLTDLIAEYDAQEYARNRASEYPSSGDQMDMIYKDNKNSTTTHADAVEAVKTKWPKDNSGPV